MIRLLFFAFVIALAVLIYRYFTTPSLYKRCPRCHGHGSWEGTRGKETCDRCGGRGKLRKD